MTVSSPDHLDDAVPVSSHGVPAMVRVVQWLERAGALDRLAPTLSALAAPTRSPAVQPLLTGQPAGHALHPALTDLPLGLWTSSLVLDLMGRESDRAAARRLLAAGIMAAVPTAVTGLAEWERTSRPESRVGSAHAVLNSAALTLYAASWVARRRSRNASGVGLSLAASALAGVSGYLGGHLTVARKTGTRHEGFVADGVGPRLTRGQASFTP